MNQTQRRWDRVERARRGDRLAFEELSESEKLPEQLRSKFLELLAESRLERDIE